MNVMGTYLCHIPLHAAQLRWKKKSLPETKYPKRFRRSFHLGLDVVLDRFQPEHSGLVPWMIREFDLPSSMRHVAIRPNGDLMDPLHRIKIFELGLPW